jgi:hypothetical protein
MTNYPHYTLTKISELDLLRAAFNYTIQNNSSIVAPYHNQSHIMNMCNTITEIYLNDKKISEREYELLLVAALFHDINHSQGKLSDIENVKIAIVEFKKFIDYYMYLKIERYEIDKVIDLIQTTQYPYTNDAETESQKIMRDSDLSQIFNYNNNFGHNICGLKIELAKDMGWSEFIKNNNKFVENIKFETDYMKNKLIDEQENLTNYLHLLKETII